jgi:predicted nucleic acid-binding protein
LRDLLIALEAAQLNAILVTENTRDFLRWQHLIRDFSKKELLLLHPSRV